MDHALDPVPAKDTLETFGVQDGASLQHECACVRCQRLPGCRRQCSRVERHDSLAAFEQCLEYVHADEARTARYEYRHGSPMMPFLDGAI
jgi:hypothetical protein